VSLRQLTKLEQTIMRKFRLFSVAFAVAAAVVAFTMLQDAPKAVASDPVKGMSVSDFKTPASLPTGTYDSF
jgi:hypothetical protein